MIKSEYSENNLVRVCKNKKDLDELIDVKKGIFPVQVHELIDVKGKEDGITIYRNYFSIDKI